MLNTNSETYEVKKKKKKKSNHLTTLKILCERFWWYESMMPKRPVIIYKVKQSKRTIRKKYKDIGGFTILIGCLDASIRVGLL